MDEQTIERKAGLHWTKEIRGRTVIGIFAVHGHIDDGYDRSFPGLFSDITLSGRQRARFVWQHRTDEPPTAAIKRIQEISRDELPPAVLGYAPSATGGTLVEREYLDTPRGNEVLTGLTAKAIEEMSYSYRALKFDFEEVDGRQVRNLYKAELYDISDVLWGMNPATLAVKRLPLADHSESVRATVEEFATRVTDLFALRAKEGRVISGENRTRIESALDAMATAEKALRDLLTASEPEKAYRETHALRAAFARQQERLRALGVF